MKEKELMIGNWLSYKDRFDCKVVQLWKHQALIDNDTEQIWNIDYECLYPIPLTYDIMIKNFPSPDTVIWEETEDNNGFVIKINGGCCMEGIFNYVHELQNALTVCKINHDLKI